MSEPDWQFTHPPEDLREYLVAYVHDVDSYVGVAQSQDGRWVCDVWGHGEITELFNVYAWAELPEPPLEPTP